MRLSFIIAIIAGLLCLVLKDSDWQLSSFILSLLCSVIGILNRLDETHKPNLV